MWQIEAANWGVISELKIGGHLLMALYCPGPGMSLARLRPVGKRGAVEKTVHSELAFFDSNCGPNERVCRDRSALPVSIPKQLGLGFNKTCQQQ